MTKNLTAYQTNIYRGMVEKRAEYTQDLERARKKNNTRVVAFLEKLIPKYNEMIKSYEVKDGQ